MPELSRYKAIPLIRATNGRIFSCTFYKIDKITLRTMVCQLPKPKPDAKGSSPAKQNNSYVLVTDFVLYCSLLRGLHDRKIARDGSYRLINLKTLQTLTINRITYTITD